MQGGPRLWARTLDGLLLPTELGPVEAPAPVLEDTAEAPPMSLCFEGRTQREQACWLHFLPGFGKTRLFCRPALPK